MTEQTSLMVTAEIVWQELETVVRGYLRRRLHGDMATVDDLVQETFLRVHRSLADLRDKLRLGPWVLRIARNVLIDHQRRRRPEQALDADAMADAEQDPTLRRDLHGLAKYLEGLVDQLPEHEAAAIRLVDVGGQSGPEAAAALGIGLPALKARLRRGREHVRAAFEQCCLIRYDRAGRLDDCVPRANRDPSCGAC